VPLEPWQQPEEGIPNDHAELSQQDHVPIVVRPVVVEPIEGGHVVHTKCAIMR
jgi:hypothetical protein